MNPRLLTIASLILAAPSLMFAQAKPKPPHTPPPAVIRHTAVVHADKDAARDAAEAAAKANKTAEKNAEKTEKTSEKSEKSALRVAEDERLLTKGIRLTASQRRQIESIDKSYDAQYRALRHSEQTADKTARKNHTPDDDAAFNAQLSTLQTQEQAALRATLTPSQQTIFDKNVLKLGKHK